MPYNPDLVHVWAKIGPHLGETVPDTLWQKHCSMKKKDKILSPGRDKAILSYFRKMDPNMTSVFFHCPPILRKSRFIWKNCHFWCFYNCYSLQNIGECFLRYKIELVRCILSQGVWKWPLFLPFTAQFSGKAIFPRENGQIWRIFVMYAIYFNEFSWTHGRRMLMYLKLLNPNMTLIDFHHPPIFQ